MLAVMKEKPGPGLAVTRREKPAPGPGEVLLKLERASICGTDLHIYRWDAWASARVRPPLVVGHECCARVVETGPGAEGVEEGDVVSVETHLADRTCFQCRRGDFHVCERVKIFGVDTDGAWAEYAVVPAFNAWKNPPGLSPEIATIQEPIGNAVHTVFTGGSPAGEKVLVAGCGPIGLFAVAVCRAAGAARVFASDVHPYRLKLAEKMGADAVFDASRSDVARQVRAATGGRGVDAAFEVSGAPSALRDCVRAVRTGGRVPVLGVYAEPVALDFSEGVVFKAVRLYGVNGRRMFQTWYTVRAFLEHGLLRPEKAITHRFALRDAEKGLQVMASGACGKVVLEP